MYNYLMQGFHFIIPWNNWLKAWIPLFQSCDKLPVNQFNSSFVIQQNATLFCLVLCWHTVIVQREYFRRIGRCISSSNLRQWLRKRLESICLKHRRNLFQLVGKVSERWEGLYSMLLLRDPGDEGSAISIRCYWHPADRRGRKRRRILWMGVFKGPGIEIVHINFTHVLLTKTQLYREAP